MCASSRGTLIAAECLSLRNSYELSHEEAHTISRAHQDTPKLSWCKREVVSDHSSSDLRISGREV
jgi:hypothetical protein